MIRPFVILAAWGFLWGYIPEATLRDYRSPVTMLVTCALLTALTETLIIIMKLTRSLRASNVT